MRSGAVHFASGAYGVTSNGVTSNIPAHNGAASQSVDPQLVSMLQQVANGTLQAETAARHLREFGAGYQQVKDFAQVCSEASVVQPIPLCAQLHRHLTPKSSRRHSPASARDVQSHWAALGTVLNLFCVAPGRHLESSKDRLSRGHLGSWQVCWADSRNHVSPCRNRGSSSCHASHPSGRFLL